MRSIDLNNVKFDLDQDKKISIRIKKEIPKNLYKYYSLNCNSLDAIQNNYLYFSHPHQLNDVMDSNFLLWNMEDYANKRFEENPILKKDYSSPKKLLDYERPKFIHEFTKCLGILSLSENCINNLMWPHYTEEMGFCLEFNTKELESFLQEAHNKVYFFPIEYLKTLRQINFNDHLLKGQKGSKMSCDAQLPTLYATTVKDATWSYENEWRFVIKHKSFDYIDHSLEFDQDQNRREKDQRKIPFKKELVKKIILGQFFFNNKRFKTSSGNIGEVETLYFNSEFLGRKIIFEFLMK